MGRGRMGVNWFCNVLTQPALVCLRERRVGRDESAESRLYRMTLRKERRVRGGKWGDQTCYAAKTSASGKQ